MLGLRGLLIVSRTRRRNVIDRRDIASRVESPRLRESVSHSRILSRGVPWNLTSRDRSKSLDDHATFLRKTSIASARKSLGVLRSRDRTSKFGGRDRIADEQFMHAKMCTRRTRRVIHYSCAICTYSLSSVGISHGGRHYVFTTRIAHEICVMWSGTDYHNGRFVINSRMTL